MLSSYLLGSKFLCYICLIFVVCLEFINICKDLFVCYLWIGKLSAHNLLAFLLNLIYLAGSRLLLVESLVIIIHLHLVKVYNNYESKLIIYKVNRLYSFLLITYFPSEKYDISNQMNANSIFKIIANSIFKTCAHFFKRMKPAYILAYSLPDITSSHSK